MDVLVLPCLVDPTEASQKVQGNETTHAVYYQSHLGIAVGFVHVFNQRLETMEVSSLLQLICEGYGN